MAKRKAKSRSRKKTAFNLTNAAMSLIVANGVSQGMFNVGLPTFLGLSSNFDTTGSSSNNSNEITAKEIINGVTGMGDGYGIYTAGESVWTGQIGQVLVSNLKRNVVPLMVTVVGVPIAFKLGKKVLGKPIINPTNRLLKAVGIGKDVKL